jgi:hypothetical protein
MHKVYQGTSDPDLSEELRFGRVAVLKKEVGRERERESCKRDSSLCKAVGERQRAAKKPGACNCLTADTKAKPQQQLDSKRKKNTAHMKKKKKKKKKCSNSKRVILPTKEKRNKTGASKAQLVSSRRRTERRRQKQQLSRDKQTNKSSNEWDKRSKRFMSSCLSALVVLCTPCLPACLPAQCLPLCQVQSSNPATIKMFWKIFSSSSPSNFILNLFN